MKKIDKNKYYSSAQVFLMGILPWKSNYTFNSKLNSKRGKEIFKPLIETHKGKQRTTKTYLIKGENIIKFLALLEKGHTNF